MTALFTGLLVCASVLVFGLVDGLLHAFTVSSDELKTIVRRKGWDNETSRQIDGPTAAKLKNLEGLATDRVTGLPLWSPELVTIQSKPRRGDTTAVNLIVRGMSPTGRSLRPGFKILGRRDVRTVINEAVSSRRMAERLQTCG